VAATQHQSSWQEELDLIQVLFEDEVWWFGRLSDGKEGYLPAACVEPLQVPALTWSTGLGEDILSIVQNTGPTFPMMPLGGFS